MVDHSVEVLASHFLTYLPTTVHYIYDSSLSCSSTKHYSEKDNVAIL